MKVQLIIEGDKETVLIVGEDDFERNIIKRIEKHESRIRIANPSEKECMIMITRVID